MDTTGFTEEDRIIAAAMDKNLIWLAKDKNGDVGAFSDKPFRVDDWKDRPKDMQGGIWLYSGARYCRLPLDGVFQSLSWDNPEPVRIAQICGDMYECPPLADHVIAKHIQRKYQWIAADRDWEYHVFEKRPCKADTNVDIFSADGIWLDRGGESEDLPFRDAFSWFGWDAPEPIRIDDICNRD